MPTHPSIASMRRELEPTYHHYTDAVISMIGVTPYSHVLRAAKRGQLLEAHSAQTTLKYSPGPAKAEIPEDYYTKKRKWDSFKEKPTWFDKPITQPKTRPTITIHQEDSPIGNTLFYSEDLTTTIGTATTHETHIGGEKALYIQHLQQVTRGLESKEARKVEGWKNAAMKLLEETAKKQGAKYILMSTGETHSEDNASNKPNHIEILETYGRLPMQHGYKLAQIRRNPTHKITSLVWVKKLK